jgi:hypothetical protein
MAEEEKINHHAKQALRSLTNKKKKWKERIKDFLYEIFIIIVAVSITLWFHNWSEKRHDRVLEKNFLIGTRNDLEKVRRNLDNGIAELQPMLNYYNTVWKQINEHKINKAFVDTNSWNLVHRVPFIYDNSRFESFKSSGYLRLIENDSLSNVIANLYTALFPTYTALEKTVYDERQRQFAIIGSKAPIDSSGTIHISDILNNPEVKFQIMYQKVALAEFKYHYHQYSQKVEEVIKEIEKELKENF